MHNSLVMLSATGVWLGLGACAYTALSHMLERILYHLRTRPADDADLIDFVQECNRQRTVVSLHPRAALGWVHRLIDECGFDRLELMRGTYARYHDALSSYRLLPTLAGVAPAIGLIGTLAGFLMLQPGTNPAEAIAKGIWTTITGISIAAPIHLFFCWHSRRADLLADQIEAVRAMLERLGDNGGDSGATTSVDKPPGRNPNSILGDSRSTPSSRTPSLPIAGHKGMAKRVVTYHPPIEPAPKEREGGTP